MKPFELGSRAGLQDLYEVAVLDRKVSLSAKTAAKLDGIRARLEASLKDGRAVYGINTGFGELASRRIPDKDCSALQFNLIRSHACGAGEPFSDEQARGLMFLRANELARGHSGMRTKTLRVLMQCLNAGIIPFVPSRGSVGASGDLAPSAHVALTLIGEGLARERDGQWKDAGSLLKKHGIKPASLEAKEGLSLINGTQAMQSVGGLALIKAFWTWHAAIASGAMTVEALKGTPRPFSPEINNLKPHKGQVQTARLLTAMFEGSQIRASHSKGDSRVQDPYSLRCMPQVHGAVCDALEYASATVETEFQSATDNPLIVNPMSSRPEAVSGGNFHGQALSLSFDFACAAMTSLGNIAERRIYQLVSDSSGMLPPFLAKNPGLESGWMIAQFTAASIASENKTLAHPACADSIPTSGNKEDFVSMGMWGALKLDKVVDNTATIIALELLAGAQGVEYHAPLKPGKGVQRTLKMVRAAAPALKGAESIAAHIAFVRKAVLNGVFA
ncbi:MAG: histidine ammonia-lyase [Elusimicrobia bacterium]|nr:histidine ammonia-lyase [Elusimicrobiota bacterium]